MIWQLFRRQSLTPFTRTDKPQTFITKEAAVHRVLYPSMLTESWVEEKSVERKRCKPTDRTAALWGLSSKIDSRIWVNFTRNGLRLGSRHQEPPHTDVSRNLEKKNWTVAQLSKVLFSDESKFCISFGNQGPRVWRKGGEAHSPSCLKSSVKFPQSVMIWGAMSSAGVGLLCFFENQRHCTRLPRNVGALRASFCWPAF